MSASNKRVKSSMTFHHLMSRIAHKVFFMKKEERDSFIEMMRRVAEFTGLKLLAWCIMENHFHILAYLPEREDIDEAEVRRRYRILKGVELGVVSKFEIDRLKKQMYSVGNFMKILKQWFTEEYNARYQHTGTLWEGVYKDVLVKEDPIELAKRAAYIHLNPIKAAITTDFTGYIWSSFNALKRGDDVALEGMRMIYKDMSAEKILSEHSEVMERCLDEIKKERASKIADMRAAGMPAPVDHLTSEAMVAQEIAHREEVAKAIVEENAIRKAAGRPSKKKELKERIRQLLTENPGMSRAAICEATGASRSTVYRCISDLQL